MWGFAPLLLLLLAADVAHAGPQYHYKYVVDDVLIRSVPTRNAFGTTSYLLGNLTSGEAAVRGRGRPGRFLAGSNTFLAVQRPFDGFQPEAPAACTPRCPHAYHRR